MYEAKRSAAVLALHDGRAGNARQAEALARALDPVAWRGLTLQPQAPWRWAAPRVWPGAGHAFGSTFGTELGAPPRWAIGCGRQAALATRLMRARGAASVQILDPRLDPRLWDLVVVPTHDRLRGDNVISLLGSLNPVDDAWLAEGRAAFPTFAQLPAPRIALLIGGPTARTPWTTQALQGLCTSLIERVNALGGSVLATTSRRTPGEVGEFLHARLRDVPGLLWRGDSDGINPYAGLLGWADRIVCTADSSNLLSEACATSAPVTAAFADRVGGRLQQLPQALREHGRLVDWDELFDAGPAIPLRETARIAAQVRERLGELFPG